ncbi:MAG: glycosyltransferase family 4 protein [Anaerolineaceae bacterium]|nr:glycosyltransferase family 4 protein [Anaerolineaceae bacterium]
MKKPGRPLSIAIDALGIDKPGGARTATLFLFEKVVQLMPDWHFTFYLSSFESFLDWENVSQVILPFHKGIVARVLFQVYLIFDLLFRKVDLIHFSKSQASFVWGKKVVFTIFDMTTLKHPQQFSSIAVTYWRTIQSWMARRADAVVTISEDAARDISSVYDLSKDNVHPIHLASQFDGWAEPVRGDIKRVINEYQLPPRYFLYIGLLAKKKNLATLIRAIEILKINGTNFGQLLLVGPKYSADEAAELLLMIRQLDLEKQIRYLGELESFDLHIILSQAFCLLLPSMHEGFGIPALEAIQLGVPIIASKVSAMPEIIGEGGLLINEFMNPTAWADAVQKLYTDGDLRKRLITAGSKQSVVYSWEKSAKKLISLYIELLEKP